MDPNGKEIHTERATPDCIGVVVRDADKGVAFLIPKVTSTDTEMLWNNDGRTVVPNVTTTKNRSVAEVDYKGKDNSDAMREFDNSTSYAAGFCNSKTLTVNGVSKNGYLGSGGEWQLVLRNSSEINSALSAIGSIALQNDTYWTSTQYDKGDAYYMDFHSSKRMLQNSYKQYNSLYVRPFYDLR